MDEGRKRLDYLRRDPRVSLTALDEASWYTHVSVQGRVVEFRDDPDLADIDRLSRHYSGAALPHPRPAPRQRLARGRLLARLGRGRPVVTDPPGPRCRWVLPPSTPRVT